jgi:hypothetical protein|tara:strand:+ start:262 stop:456 length:195 start_codon:yes stop_codon:yes gene_type:complete
MSRTPDHRRLRNKESLWNTSQKQRWAKENLALKKRLDAAEKILFSIKENSNPEYLVKLIEEYKK